MKLFAMTLLASLTLVSGIASANSYINPAVGDNALYSNAIYGDTDVTVKAAQGGWFEIENFLDSGNRFIKTSATNEKVYIRNSRGIRQLLVDFADPVGTRYNVSVDNCSSVATLADKAEQINATAGEFSEVVRVEFTNRCRDGGLEHAWFAKGVGVVQWQKKVQSAPNIRVAPHIKTLVGGMFGSTAYPQLQGLVLSGEISPVARINDGRTVNYANARISVKNASDSTLKFMKSGTQHFQATLLDSNGAVINEFDDGMMQPMILKSFEIKAGETDRHTFRLPLVDTAGAMLPIGSYTLRLEVNGLLFSPHDGMPHPSRPAVELPVRIYGLD